VQQNDVMLNAVFDKCETLLISLLPFSFLLLHKLQNEAAITPPLHQSLRLHLARRTNDIFTARKVKLCNNIRVG
jgi:hypothetical protein